MDPHDPRWLLLFFTVTYIMNAKIGFGLPWGAAYAIGAIACVAYVGFCVLYGKKQNGIALAK